MKMELCNSENKCLRTEVNELHAAVGRMDQTISQLKQQLAEKAQQLSGAIEKSQRRKIAHTKAMNELRVTKEALEEVKGKHKALELKLQKQLEKQDTTFKRELEEKKGCFQKKLSRLLKQHQQELFEREKKRKNQFRQEDKNFIKQLMELSEQWVAKAQQSAENQRELEEKIQRMLKDNKEVNEFQTPTKQTQRKRGHGRKALKMKTMEERSISCSFSALRSLSPPTSSDPTSADHHLQLHFISST